MPKRFRLAVEPLESRITPTIYTVSTTATTGPGSLASALTQANTNSGPDEINFAVTGTIIGPNNDVFKITDDVTITGPGSGQLTIQTSFNGGVFSVVSPAHAVISGLTATGSTSGGGVSTSGTLTLNDVIVRGLISGGSSSTGNLTLNRCRYESNSIDQVGGTFDVGGGAIQCIGGTLTATDTTFVGNHVFRSGGAINCHSTTVVLNRCTFTLNTAAFGDGGGAVYLSGGSLAATNCTFAGNTSGAAGGGILASSGAGISLLNCTVAGNSAQSYGGGIGLSTAPNPVLKNSIVADNILSQAGQPNKPDDYTGSMGPGSQFSIIGANPSGANGNGQNGNQIGTVANPIDARLGSLGDNGGLTQTIVPDAGSPAIDRGSNSAASALSTDQRGGNYTRVSNGMVDIGAVEVQSPPSPPPPQAGPGAILAGGSTDSQALALLQSSGSYSIAGPVAFFSGNATVRVASADVNNDGTPDYVGVAGPGGGPRVVVVDGASGNRLADFFAFEASFAGGLFVTSADIDLDGRAEFIVTPDEGGGPRVTVFSLLPNGQIQTKANFFGIDDPNFRGGARPALGDVDGDGIPDLLVAAGFGGGPRVALFDGGTIFTTRTKLLNDFYAFPEDANTLRNGIFAALGDINGDGFADLAFGGGPGGAPRVFILSGQFLLNGNPNTFSQPIANFFVAGNDSDRGGVRLAVKNADGDSKADLIVGSGEGSPAKVRVYLGANFSGTGEPGTFQDISVFGGATLADGVYVG